jgi:hypothetical protein
MKRIKKVTISIGLVAILFSGCDLVDNEDSVEGSGSSANDSLTLSKTGEGFLVTYTKQTSDYGEVVYYDGNYPRKLITSNSKGTISATCIKSSNEVYRCTRSNLSGDYATTTVTFTEGVQYKWYTTLGFDHVKGSIEAVTESNNGILTIN